MLKYSEFPIQYLVSVYACHEFLCPMPGIDQNVYTYARFSFNNSSNALSAHKNFDTRRFLCLEKAVEEGCWEAWGAGRAVKLCDWAPFDVTPMDAISIIAQSACPLDTLAGVCSGFKIFILLSSLAGPRWRLNTITQSDLPGRKRPPLFACLHFYFTSPTCVNHALFICLGAIYFLWNSADNRARNL